MFEKCFGTARVEDSQLWKLRGAMKSRENSGAEQSKGRKFLDLLSSMKGCVCTVSRDRVRVSLKLASDVRGQDVPKVNYETGLFEVFRQVVAYFSPELRSVQWKSDALASNRNGDNSASAMDLDLILLSDTPASASWPRSR
jgi:hypothetical protein